MTGFKQVLASPLQFTWWRNETGKPFTIWPSNFPGFQTEHWGTYIQHQFYTITSIIKITQIMSIDKAYL